MTEDERISGDQGSIKPEETLTDIVRTVASVRSDERGQMRAAANGALIRWLKALEAGSEADYEVVELALSQHGFDSVNEFVDAFTDAGEPVMGYEHRTVEVDIEDANPTFELQEPGDPDEH